MLWMIVWMLKLSLYKERKCLFLKVFFINDFLTYVYIIRWKIYLEAENGLKLKFDKSCDIIFNKWRVGIAHFLKDKSDLCFFSVTGFLITTHDQRLEQK